jgi:hypothetical protein
LGKDSSPIKRTYLKAKAKARPADQGFLPEWQVFSAAAARKAVIAI